MNPEYIHSGCLIDLLISSHLSRDWVWSLPFRFFDQRFCTRFFFLPRAVPYPPHSPLFYHPVYIWRDGHIIRMGNSRIPKKVLDGKFHGRRLVGRPRLRWEDIRRDSQLMLNIRGWRRLLGDRDIWRRTVGRGQGPMRAIALLKKEKEEEKKKNIWRS